MSEDSELIAIATEVGPKLGLSEISFCGKGAFKETFRATDPDHGTVALKLVDRSKIDLQRTEREIDSLRRCSSRHIATFFKVDCHVTSDGQTFDIIVEEFLDGGTLEQQTDNTTLDTIRAFKLLSGLASALTELEQKRLVHRDIKPANIMFRKEDLSYPVLVDFGLVRDLSKSSLTHSWIPNGPGTPFYSAPEQLNNDKHMIDWRTDQFCIGVVMSLAVTSKHPYDTGEMSPSEIIYAVAHRRPISDEFTASAVKANLPQIIKMVQPWPIQRYTSTAALLSALQI